MGKFAIQTEDGFIVVNNIVTNAGIDSIPQSFITDVGPGWLYMAVGSGTSTPTATDTVMGEELCRRPISGVYSPSTGVARFLGVFTPNEANGEWRELGIFDTKEDRDVLSSCDSITGWSSDSTLSAETTIVQVGAASIKCTTGATASTNPFYTTSALNYERNTLLSSDHFQFWYRATKSVGSLTVRLGNDVSNYRQWSWTPGVTNQWAHFQETIGSGAVTGSPNENIGYFYIARGSTTNLTEYLDALSVFRADGTLMARGAVNAEKVYDTVRNVYYSIKIQRP